MDLAVRCRSRTGSCVAGKDRYLYIVFPALFGKRRMQFSPVVRRKCVDRVDEHADVLDFGLLELRNYPVHEVRLAKILGGAAANAAILVHAELVPECEQHVFERGLQILQPGVVDVPQAALADVLAREEVEHPVTTAWRFSLLSVLNRSRATFEIVTRISATSSLQINP